MQKIKMAAPLLLFVFFLTSRVFSQGIQLKDWKILSEDNRPGELTDTVFLDKPCVKLDGKIRSAIWNSGVSLKNFRIDLDMAGAVMGGLGFHVKDEQNYQFIYFRPGYGGTEEAVQYIPIYNGALSWVMYGKYQSNADIKQLQWFHATIEVRGNNLKVFTNNNKKADMDLTMLNTASDRGSILLRTMFGVYYFANLRIRELPEAITDWEISNQLPMGTDYNYSSIKEVKKWTKINEARDDYVNLCRYYDDPKGVVFARHEIQSDSNEIRTLNFDVVGASHIFLNGKEIFNYDKFKLDRIEEGTNRIRLHLNKGKNELVFLTTGDSDIFGKGFNSLGRLQHQNWGFIASLSKPGF